MLESRVATHTKVWRPKEPESVVKYLILASFTGNYDLPKKAKFV
jgi:hypothetical protein